VLSAREAGVDTAAFVEGNSEVFRRLSTALNVQIDNFLRTTEDRYARGVQVLWQQLKSGDLYQKEYSGLYCTGCEAFISSAISLLGYAQTTVRGPLP
jgi:methionyl-tRNA synthetase